MSRTRPRKNAELSFISRGERRKVTRREADRRREQLAAYGDSRRGERRRNKRRREDKDLDFIGIDT